MAPSHVIVDGSNIATEGRSTPSLGQLDDAVRQFQDEFPGAETIVVVDATFGHRIEPGDRKAFEDAVAHGELVSPPAGALGRGDAFVLRIAERVNGQVLSNDSFQEFHGEHPWLFDEGRLIGGKPVPGVGWIFTLRTPVRGPRSRAVTGQEGRRRGRRSGATAEAPAAEPTRKRGGRSAAMLAAVEAAAAEATEAAVAPGPVVDVPGELAVKAKRPSRRGRRRRGGGDPEVRAAIEAATEEAVTPASAAAGGRRRRGKSAAATEADSAGPQAVNDPLTFLTFISEHPLGDRVVGTVSNFVSHGAMVDIGDMHCYVPLSGLGVPAPKSAREVLRRGETREFEVVALDPPRRGAQLALPDLGETPTQGAPGTSSRSGRRGGQPPAKKAQPAKKAAPVRKAAPEKKAAPAKKAQPAKKAAPVRKAAPVKRAAPAKKAQPAKKAAPVRKAAPEKKAAPAKKAQAAKKAQPVKRAAPAKKAQPAKKAALAKKAQAAKKATPVKKATPARNSAPAKKAPRGKR